MVPNEKDCIEDSVAKSVAMSRAKRMFNDNFRSACDSLCSTISSPISFAAVFLAGKLRIQFQAALDLKEICIFCEHFADENVLDFGLAFVLKLDFEMRNAKLNFPESTFKYSKLQYVFKAQTKRGT